MIIMRIGLEPRPAQSGAQLTRRQVSCSPGLGGHFSATFRLFSLVVRTSEPLARGEIQYHISTGPSRPAPPHAPGPRASDESILLRANKRLLGRFKGGAANLGLPARLPVSPRAGKRALPSAQEAARAGQATGRPEDGTIVARDNLPAGPREAAHTYAGRWRALAKGAKSNSSRPRWSLLGLTATYLLQSANFRLFPGSLQLARPASAVGAELIESAC